jgi:hypothetical protein
MENMNNHPWQAEVMAASRRADLLAAAEGVRRAKRVRPRWAPARVAAVERTGLFLIRRGERLRQDALRHRAAPVS